MTTLQSLIYIIYRSGFLSFRSVIARAAKSTLTAGSKDIAARPQILPIATDKEGFISARAHLRIPQGKIRQLDFAKLDSNDAVAESDVLLANHIGLVDARL